jgi:hypothetical protein
MARMLNSDGGKWSFGGLRAQMGAKDSLIVASARPRPNAGVDRPGTSGADVGEPVLVKAERLLEPLECWVRGRTKG